MRVRGCGVCDHDWKEMASAVVDRSVGATNATLLFLIKSFGLCSSRLGYSRIVPAVVVPIVLHCRVGLASVISMATQKRAHHALTLEKKMDVILDFESGSYSKTALATKHGAPKTSLTRILHDKDKLQDAFETSRFGPQRKRLRHGDHEELEKCLVLWLRRARSQSIPINGPLIRAKAEEFVLQLGITDFLCSEGWLTRFKERNGLVFRTIAGEAAAADATACRDWRAGRLPEIMMLLCMSQDKEYKVDDVPLTMSPSSPFSMAAEEDYRPSVRLNWMRGQRRAQGFKVWT
ncbi:hypothetical protein HPB47_018103 [Ixodes persulcatus]|uniref:Uncharacterized protein n=1 Tax=Ixodes persulcatus TaxID=34615 RepID=A0AC60QZY4_IXOPE|nr:hypothetical protein HPB47_018103 [Ixodes persulcatus]